MFIIFKRYEVFIVGVTIATLTGDNGLLTKAGQAKNASEKASEKEKIQVEIAGSYDFTGKLVASQVENNIKKNIKDATVTATIKENPEEKFFPVKVTYNNGHKYQVSEKGSINFIYQDGDYTAVIPDGYSISNKPDEASIENGLVVLDEYGNEWVWIPVSGEDLTLMYTEDQTGWTLLETTAPNAVVTKYKTPSITLGSRTLNRTNPGLTADPYYREPDLVVGNGTGYDAIANNRKAAGFVETDGTTVSSLETMAIKLKDDYKDMIESVRENKGFYIGRYEIGKNTRDNNKPQVKAGTVMNNTNWYNLYSACKSFSDGDVHSRMIWSCQWDQACRFINGSGATGIINDSSSYGNYLNSTKSTDICGPSNFNNTTGRSTDWKIKNIYDMAGNCWEITQEAYGKNKRARRGR